MKHIIGLHGKRGAGKDTVGTALVHRGYDRMKFAAPLYRELTVLGFSDEQVAEHKEILRPIFLAIGDARRFFYEDHYLDLTLGDIHTGPDRIVITDLRFQNEARGLRKLAERMRCQVTLVRIDRPDFARDTIADRHISECDLDRWTDWDVIQIANSGELHKLKDLACELSEIPVNDTPWAV